MSNSCWKKSEVQRFKGLFCTNYGLIMTIVRGNQTMRLKKTLVRYYHHAKFQESLINSPWKKFNKRIIIIIFLTPMLDGSQCNASAHRHILLCKFTKRGIFLTNCRNIHPELQNKGQILKLSNLCFKSNTGAQRGAHTVPKHKPILENSQKLWLSSFHYDSYSLKEFEDLRFSTLWPI